MCTCVMLLTLVWLLAYVFWCASSPPGIARIPVGGYSLVGDAQLHLIGGVNDTFIAAPFQNRTARTVSEGQGFRDDIKAQASQQSSVKEAMLGTPFPQLGSLCRAISQDQGVFLSQETFARTLVLDGKGVISCETKETDVSLTNKSLLVTNNTDKKHRGKSSIVNSKNNAISDC